MGSQVFTLFLDITERIIAMGFPSESIEGVYRNPMSEVVRYSIDASYCSAFAL